MKKLKLFVWLLIIPIVGNAQCNPFFNLKNERKWEITNYNASKKLVSRQVNTVKSLEEKGDGWTATINMQSFNKKDKLDLEKDLEMTCEDGVIKLDMSRFFPEEMMAGFKDMNLNFETENLEMPSELEVGTTLNDASITVTGDIPFSMETNITDREVVAQESITTPAGTFDCYKITYNIEVKTMMTMEMKAVEWVAKDVGMVKSESFGRNGELSGTSLLTSFE